MSPVRQHKHASVIIYKVCTVPPKVRALTGIRYTATKHSLPHVPGYPSSSARNGSPQHRRYEFHGFPHKSGSDEAWARSRGAFRAV